MVPIPKYWVHINRTLEGKAGSRGNFSLSKGGGLSHTGSYKMHIKRKKWHQHIGPN